MGSATSLHFLHHRIEESCLTKEESAAQIESILATLVYHDCAIDNNFTMMRVGFDGEIDVNEYYQVQDYSDKYVKICWIPAWIALISFSSPRRSSIALALLAAG